MIKIRCTVPWSSLNFRCNAKVDIWHQLLVVAWVLSVGTAELDTKCSSRSITQQRHAAPWRQFNVPISEPHRNRLHAHLYFGWSISDLFCFSKWWSNIVWIQHSSDQMWMQFNYCTSLLFSNKNGNFSMKTNFFFLANIILLTLKLVTMESKWTIVVFFLIGILPHLL